MSDRRVSERTMNNPPPCNIVFFGVPFSPENPPKDKDGKVVDLDALDIENQATRYNVGSLGLGKVIGAAPNETAIFAIGSFYDPNPARSPVFHALEEKSGWRDNLLCLCRDLGIVNAPEPAWIIAWQSWDAA